MSAGSNGGTAPTGDFLAAMAASSRERALAARAVVAERELLARLRDLPPLAPLALHADGFDVIAEIKLKSPALGALADAAATSVAARAREYAGAGAAAVSVLTEPTRFDGHLDHLREAAVALAGLPAVAMRKDFLVDPYQVHEARAAGAGGVLLILRMLDDAVLEAMVGAAVQAGGLFVLLEAFDADDLARAARLASAWRRAADAPPLLVGLNTRDLRTLEVDVGRLARCREHFPAGLPAVAESGLEGPDDVAAAAALGYDLALVGSALMRAGAPGETLAAMLAAARRARREAGWRAQGTGR